MNKLRYAVTCTALSVATIGGFAGCRLARRPSAPIHRIDATFEGAAGEERAGQGPSGPERCLPGDNAAGTCRRVGSPELYEPDNLFEYIDGAAEAYLAYDFAELATCTYANPRFPDAEITIDVYDMGKPENAFGIYSTLRYPEARFVNIGVEGFRSEATLDFWKGRYYVHVSTCAEREGIAKEVELLGRKTAALIHGTAAPPRETAFFPSGGLKPHSARFVPRNVFGHSFFRNAYLAQYEIGGHPTLVFFMRYQNSRGAQAALKAYKSYLAKAKRPFRTRKEIGDGGLEGTDTYYGKVLFFVKGRFVAGALGVRDEGRVLETLISLAARLGA